MKQLDTAGTLAGAGLALILVGCDARAHDAPAPAPIASAAGDELDAADGEPVMMVFVDDDGVVRMDGAALLDDKTILAHAEAFGQRAPHGHVVVRAHPAALHGRAVRVLDLLREAQLTRVSFDVVR